MSTAPPPDFSANIERRRVEALFERLPANVISLLLGVLLVFLFMLPHAPDGLLKAWAAFMLTTVAVRGWVWHVFRTSVVPLEQLPRWEWGYGIGMLLTAMGWSMLCGPLFPSEPGLQGFILMLCIIVAFSGMVFASVSVPAFLLFIVPTIVPAMFRYVALNSNAPLMAYAGALVCFSVLLMIHRTLHKFSMQLLYKQAEAEHLLAEQNAIFQSTSLAIAIFSDGHVVKCNQRMGELFGRNLQSLYQVQASQLFAREQEGARFIEAGAQELNAGGTMHSIERMRRGDGSEFWAELSGRRMSGEEGRRSVWLIDDVTMRKGREATEKN